MQQQKKIALLDKQKILNQIKEWLKNFATVVILKRKVWSFFYRFFCITKINIIETFPIFIPYSTGNYNDRAKLTIETINQTFPFVRSLARSVHKGELVIENIESLTVDPKKKSSSIILKEMLDKHGSDKANRHNYHNLYGLILYDKLNIKNIFEIGLGTNNVDIISHMGINGKPGASLRAFRDYCPNASIYGADVDKRILFQEDRIKTFFLDQTKPATFDALLKKIPNKFDLVIDDGLHAPNANIASLEFGLKIIKTGGWVVIEDIPYEETLSIWQSVSALLPKTFYESHIFSANEAFMFAVKKLQ